MPKQKLSNSQENLSKPIPKYSEHSVIVQNQLFVKKKSTTTRLDRWWWHARAGRRDAFYRCMLLKGGALTGIGVLKMVKKMRNMELFPLKCYCAGKFYVKILSSGVKQQRERSGAPQGPIQGAPRGARRLKMGKNDQNLSIFLQFFAIFDNEGPSYLFSFLHQCSRNR